MTELLLHGIVRADAPPPADAPPHLRIAAGHLSALATPATPRLLTADDEPPLVEAEAHHRILSAYAARTDVLPVRFGAVFTAEQSLLAALVSEANTHLANLERLAGCVEYILSLDVSTSRNTAVWTVPETVVPDGRTFLAEKRAARNEARSRAVRRADFAQSLPEALSTAIVTARQTAPARREGLASYALLVDRDSVARLIEVAQDLCRGAAALDLRMKLRGPGPCYAFADADVDLDVAGRVEAHA